MHYLTFNKPVKAAQFFTLISACRNINKQITHGDHCYKGNHDHNITYGILQFHPTN